MSDTKLATLGVDLAQKLGVTVGDKVTVEGKEFLCKKTRVTSGKIVTTVWTNEAQGMLKFESTGDSTSSMVVTALAKKLGLA